MIRNYVIFSVTMENEKHPLKMAPKLRLCILRFHSVITNENLKTYIPKERRRIEEGKYRGKETLQA